MSSIAKSFEKSIHRIHELIKQPDSVVKWNDYVKDPDNPTQSRQVDITIRRNDNLTLIECRIHKDPQDVTWIEELMGRRTSLRADAVIAVSATGFTHGAKKKAEAHGIILRDLQTLTEEEVRAWGHNTRVWLYFLRYEDIHLDFGVPLSQRNNINIEAFQRDIHNNTNNLYLVFDVVARQIDEIIDKGHHEGPLELTATMQTKGMRLAGVDIREIIFSGRVERIKNELDIPSVVAYDEPEKAASDRSVLIEKVDMGDFEITQSSNRVAVAVDFSAIKTPPNTQFRIVSFDFKRIVTVTAFYPLALTKLAIEIDHIKLDAHMVAD
ncbi:MAG: restriction endonuclease [Syntrophobacteraceae bacterium]